MPLRAAHQLAKRPSSYRLTERLAAENGGPILCLAASAFGREYKLHAKRPGPELNTRVTRRAARLVTLPAHASLVAMGTTSLAVPLAEEKPAPLTIVRIDGPLEQRSGYHDLCSGWSDGHDAVADRLIAAFEDGDVLLVVDSPGGAAAGLQEAVRQAVHVKEELGRKVTVYADEMIGSAAYWWAACIGDEIYAPASGMVGSIGARSGHASIAGALEKEGVAVTFFCWPDEGKVAFAPELPLSDVGRERGERDVKACGEAFASAVGPRRGMSTQKIKSLRADVLSGQSAIGAKLIDGIASFGEVLDYALTLATQGEDMKLEDQPAKPGADADPEKKPDDGPPPADKAECASCSAANDDDAKYCNMCGAGMPGMNDDPDGDGDGKKTVAPDKDEPDASAPPADERRTTAEILGLRPDASALAVKSAALKLTAVVAQAMKITETETADAMIGAVIAHAGDAKRLATVEADNRQLRKTAAAAERMALLRKLAAANLPGHTRGDLFIDKVDDKTGARTMAIAPQFEEMKLSTLRGLVDSKLKSAPTSPRATPFDPSPDAARQASDTAVVEQVASTDVIADMSTRSTATKEQLARSYAAIVRQSEGVSQ